MKITRVALLTCCWTLVAAPALAGSENEADWPRWRGAEATGVSPETGWSPAGTNGTLWAKNIGFGHSSFAVANGRLYAMGYDNERGLDVIHCMNPETGEEIWTHTYEADFWNEGHDGGTCTTPAVDGDMVYASNREGRLFALRADSGSVVWSRDLQEELGVTPPRWGFSGSPVIVGDTVIANVGTLSAYDKSTGVHKWTSERELGNAYSTPIEYDWFGRPCVLVLNGLGLAAIDRNDGSEIAFHPWSRNPDRSIYGATPVIVGEHLFISANSGGGCVMLTPKQDGTFDVAWESRVMSNNYAGCVLYDGHLYGFDRSILKCIDLEGNEMWRRRGIGVGAVVVVGGKLLIIGAKGELIVAEATPEDYIELSRHDVLDGGAYWATPVLSHGLVYARNSLGDMVCRDYRGDVNVPDARLDLPQEMPAAEALFAKHVEAIGGARALRSLNTLSLTGTGERQGGGPVEHCDAQLSWSANGSFVWRFASGLDFGYRGDSGWSMSAQGPAVLEGAQLDNYREVGNLYRVLEENWGFESAETTEARVFDDRTCYVVQATVTDGNTRTLYFEAESGLLAGHEGDDVPLWTFDDYQKVNGVLIPMEWSFFATQSGAMTSAKFTKAVANQTDASRFQPPALIALMTRTEQENEQVNERLRKDYNHLVGRYQLITGNMIGTPLTISIDGGALRSSFAGGQLDYLAEPDEQGRMYSMTNRELYIQLSEHEDKHNVDMVMWAYGNKLGDIGPVDGD